MSGFGYVKAKYLESKPSRDSSWPAKVVLNDLDSHLNIRSGPLADDSII